MTEVNGRFSTVNKNTGHVLCETAFIRHKLKIGGPVELDGTNTLVINGNISATNINAMEARQVIWRPGYTGPTVPGVYADWGEMIDFLETVYGPKTIILDTTYGNLVIPPGAWNMDGITLYSPICNLQVPSLVKPCIIQDGATLNGLCGMFGPVLYTYEGTTEPCIIIDSTQHPNDAGFWIDTGASLTTSGTQPFIQFEGTMIAEIIFGPGTSTTTGTVPVLYAAGTSQMFLAGIGNISNIQDNTLGSDAGAVVFLLIGSNSFNGDFNFAISQPAITGFTQVLSLVQNSPFIFRRSVAPTANDDETIGVKSGDTWIDTALNDVYICANASTGAAIWKLV